MTFRAAQDYGGHNLRRGFATSALAGGATERAVQRHGRWRSPASMSPYVDEDTKLSAMTMIYARIADKTVAEEYFNVTEKVEALYGQLRQLPHNQEGSEMRKLRGEMHRRMLGNGRCARPVETDSHFESICESCTFFVTTIEFRPTLQAQRGDSQNMARSGGQQARPARP
jgi:hypothetical protein